MSFNFDCAPERRNTFSYKWDARAQEFPENPDVIPVWVADMDFACPDAIVEAIQKRAANPVYGYGTLPLNTSELVTDWQRKRNGWSVDPSWVVYSNGVVPAINMAVAAFTQRDEGVLIQTPVYYPFMDAIRNNRRRLVENRLLYDGERYTIDFEDLERCAARPDTKLMILCNPHNPVGRVYTEEELRRIGEICLRHRVVLFADEIHSDLVYTSQGHRHIPIASLSPEISQNTLTAMAPSKTFNIAGLQISAIISENPNLRYEFGAANGFSYVPALFGAVGLTAAYSDPACEAYVDELTDYLWGNFEALDNILRTRTPRIRCIRPEATYLMWIDCRDLHLSDAELRKLWVEEAGVGIELGSVFGEVGEGFIRFNIGSPRAVIVECAERIARVYENHAF